VWGIETVLVRHGSACYHEQMRPRREQAAVNVRSDFIAERLKLLTRGGKSQAAVLEELVAKAVDSDDSDHENEIFQRALEIAERSSKLQRRFKSIIEFDAHEYDANGNPR
jgi:hypothetical protein